MISTLIFDLDGLIADTEKLHRRAYQEVLEEFGFTLPDRHYDEHWIRDGKGIVEYLAVNPLPLSVDVVRAKKAERYDRLVRSSAEPMPGAISALERLRRQLRMALATSSHRDAAHAVLQTLGIEEFFEHIATKESAPRLKPFPDIFLGVATALEVSPCECVVVEDAQKGITAAHSAGMYSIAVPNDQTRNNDFSKASMVLRSLEELTLDTIEQCAN
jgi:HAD superfamily hydrolase (TIGR01509 family)